MRTIIMGSDEFILYIRKQHPNCQTTTQVLGRKIADFMIAQGFYDQNANKGEPFCNNEQRSYWVTEENEEFIRSISLPLTANQYTFDRALLPELYDFLDELGQNSNN